MYADGGGLYLQVTHAQARSWIFRFMLDGRARSMGLGPLHTITLAEARTKATECRKLCLDGRDPIIEREQARARLKLDAAKALTFRACAEGYIKAHKAGWIERTTDHWHMAFEAFVYPVFGDVSVQAVDTGLVMQALEPIWTAKTVTAVRVRGRIESVLDWATTRGHRAGENPARWRGHLANLLPRRSKVSKVVHYPALPFKEVPAFMAAIERQAGIAALAVQFTILTAVRTAEATGARWDEIDEAEATWTIPVERMKAGIQHRVPLSLPALALVQQLKPLGSEYVFPGMKRSQPLNKTAMLKVLTRMGRKDITVHGFRSAFRDWASESTSFPREVAEAALAHVIENRVEAAYRRGDLFQKRRELMDAWAVYCGG
ncbi:tyrosine-type recombinase/integrase [Methylobacterium sp. J-026]|uniref:tyrosine-type recombinase/integrase n=1 Tax=Methylobacterium sp. J-026 TaxID=2836624 RepID=UPI001FBB6009|nr:integrase arm-type DNA-binding domain-containing protein [Methylobacterium sp. J-026]MCJ2138403.1 tyrosine-type recombinase/integrase [Methylobacterium sp. J-026]